MKRMIQTMFLPIAAALLAVGAPAFGQADDDAYGDDYQAGNYGRVRYHDGGVTLRRAASDVGATAEDVGHLNSPVFPGDTLTTDFGQRAEIQLAGGSVVRVDRDTELTFLALPDPYATIADNTILQLTDGALRIDALLSDEEEFRIDTPASSVYLLGDGDFRIEVDEDGLTRVFSRRGVAEVVGQGGSVLVRGGTRAEVYPGSLPREADPFNTFASDSFDRWVENRETAYRGEDRYADNGEAYEELPQEVRPYYGELSAHGNWAHTSDYGYVWYPDRVAVGWRPYTDGYWNYGPHGYFWVSHKPWGWAPYHYGRWAWVAGNGWGWIPGRVFAGAWVAWSWGSLYVGWSPLDYWNAPCYVRSTYYGHYDPYAWTFVHYNHFGHRRYQRYAVGVHDVKHRLRDHAVVTRPPRVGPRDLARSEASRSRAGRLAREDRVAALRPVGDNDRRQRRTLNDLERNLVPDGRRGRASAARRDRLGDDGPPSGSRRRTPGPAGEAPNRVGRIQDDANPARKDGTTDPRFRRRLTRTDSNSGRRAVGDSRGRTSDRGAPAEAPRTAPRRDASPRTPPPTQRADSPDTDRRVRDLYQRMSRPRTTRERPSGSAVSSKPSGTPSRSQPRARPTAPQRPQPKARPTTPQRSQPRARPTAPQRSQPKARPTAPQRSQPRARPTAPQRSQPRARPTAPQRSQPRARPAAPQRSQPRARPTAPQRSQPRARPTAPQRSQPKARPTAPQRSQPKARPTAPQRSQPKARPTAPRRSQPKARPSGGSSNRGARSSGRSKSNGKKD